MTEEKDCRIRFARREDLPRIMDIYAYARDFMAKNGNPNQWTGGWPWQEVIEDDIEKKQLYVIEDESGPHGVFAFMIGEDETYEEIDGEWISETEYGTIHRIAGDGKIPGVLAKALKFCTKETDHIRIDTHHDNNIMQYLLEKYGFTRCGIIRCTEDGTPRIAYERV
jgi:RimJ/RimL family protein N-acetyltransferase